ncbi:MULTISPECIES: aldehyde dehydrogenase family protein [Bradyrhizobium]|jgi:acyl-CoA reductase-like NAD-dependent aldehyde dehydrogenase|uniref:Aldehyde dehydrogenase family protein n=2 Tax=Bradyrhizobium TaxID=374 RepID=A0ABS5G637_9BRAD|nr:MULTISPECIES: aldehyde dehydrogenase family protein [Bradyrhizobium]MBR1136718.1 aldehyde dehydrogenase family protein [Bradyrhizobium denitrificans]MDU1492929.1 aldehyde dehydrogenase family protein [Bradyrhizobium sp.]MDU1543366.1 aldehyde dehydrogenase family protein [Bradyrhizobium sp.]MDU1690118.1 aldehyde dehydrogenase family protein [Bradyrhizobium sp.]MDU1805069.1 aldehyde dehydrogenase family protein [Bradyrhizobium sp.]
MSDYHLLIGGALVPGETTMPVINPATEEVLTDCPRASKDQLDAAVAAAKAAFPAWAATPITERRRLIGKMADIIETHANDLARILTSEQGKPLADATGEVLGMAGFFRYLASLDLPMRVLERSGDRQVEAYRRPLGVVGAIIPWNFPLLILGFKLPPALLAGNTLVVKPAPTTPLSTLRFAELVKDVLPAGVLNVIADANDLGDPMTKHPDIRKISFTGSTATGQKVMASAAQTLKRITLELGGNDAGIVLDDVDPKTVAPGIFDGAFQNSGQVCLAIKRLYVHESVYDEICDELVAIAKSTVVDDGSKQGTKLGPLQNKMQYEKVKAFLDDAHKNGKVIAGGAAMDRPGYFIAPTIVRDIAEGSKLVDEEQFGPVLPVIKYSDSDDVIRRANASSYGLGASVWSSDPKRAHEIATRIEAGTVWINKHLDMAPHIPFGGAKQSGIGSEFAEEGLAEFTQLQIINGPGVAA